MTLAELEALICTGESEQLEFKRSTSQLRSGCDTLCAFLNGRGGTVLFGVGDSGRIVGQHCSDASRRELAEALRRIEPSAQATIDEVPLPGDGDKRVIAVRVPPGQGMRPFFHDWRAFERIASSTGRMPQPVLEGLLLERSHPIQRWETQKAVGITAADLDQEELLRTLRVGVQAGRLPEAALSDPANTLERLQLLRDGAITLAAQVLFARGVVVLPQCQLRLARFRGTDKREFLDQRQLNGHAFQLLEEAILFCQRHLSTAARIPRDRLEREEQLAIPLPALREALVNALCHRDYSQQGAAISLAIFEDRLELWSEGGLPFGLEPAALKREHASRPRNLLIADVFFRRGLIERWGRGTQVIVEECERAGCSEPSYRVSGGCFVVTFPLRVGLGAESKPESGPESKPESGPESQLARSVLLALEQGPLGKAAIADALGHRSISASLNRTIRGLMAEGRIAPTIPEKPNSRLQKYRLITTSSEGQVP
jgi:ATP-dependent DNA helicase RecG